MARAGRSTTTRATLIEEDAPIESLIDNPRNPNIHPDDQIERLMASLRARGQNRAILARRENRMLIAGHGVRIAARRLGWTDIRVAFWDVDQATADRAMLADNRLAELSVPDTDRVSELLREIPEMDWLSVGFNGNEAEKILEDLKDHEVRVFEIDTSQVFDTFWMTVKGPLERQALVFQRMRTLLAEYPDVSITDGITTEPNP